MTPLSDIIDQHGLNKHYFADDSDLYLTFKPSPGQPQNTVSSLESCVGDVNIWMKQNKLKLNGDKTELMIYHHPRKSLENCEMIVDGSPVVPAKSASNLGIRYDTSLQFVQHVSRVVQSASHQLRNIGHIRQFLTTDAAKTLIQAMVTSRLDYGNSLLAGLPDSQIQRLQKVQNCAARIITFTKRHEHITPVLEHLHWLPVKYRIEHNVLTHTYKALHNEAPSYISDLVQKYTPSRSLRSENQLLLQTPRTHTCTYGDRSFSAIAPTLWNNLPNNIRTAGSVTSFKRCLKTYYFRIAFNVT